MAFGTPESIATRGYRPGDPLAVATRGYLIGTAVPAPPATQRRGGGVISAPRRRRVDGEVRVRTQFADIRMLGASAIGTGDDTVLPSIVISTTPDVGDVVTKPREFTEVEEVSARLLWLASHDAKVQTSTFAVNAVTGLNATGDGVGRASVMAQQIRMVTPRARGIINPTAEELAAILDSLL